MAKTESCFRVDKNLSLYTGKKNIRLLFLKCGFGCYVMAKRRISHMQLLPKTGHFCCHL